MNTFSQMFFKKQIRLFKKKNKRSPSLQKCPQKKGIVTNIVVINPKKPNSAKRHIAKILLSDGKKIRAAIPGEHHTGVVGLKQYSKVLIRGGRVRDIIGLHYKVLLGSLDAKSPVFRRKARSKYGVIKPTGLLAAINIDTLKEYIIKQEYEKEAKEAKEALEIKELIEKKALEAKEALEIKELIEKKALEAKEALEIKELIEKKALEAKDILSRKKLLDAKNIFEWKERYKKVKKEELDEK